MKNLIFKPKKNPVKVKISDRVLFLGLLAFLIKVPDPELQPELHQLLLESPLKQIR